MKPLLVIGLLFAAIASFAEPAPVMRTTADINRAVFTVDDIGRRFDLTGRVVANGGWRPRHFTLSDRTGVASLSFSTNLSAANFALGNDVRVTGEVIASADKLQGLEVRGVSVIGHGSPPEPVATDIRAINAGHHTGQCVRFRGTVIDVSPDDIDPNWAILTVADDDGSVCASYCTDKQPLPMHFLGATVSITGFCKSYPVGHRHFLGNSIDLYDPANVRVLAPAPLDPFAARPLEDVWGGRSRRLPVLGYRMATGRVLATWRPNKLLVRTVRGSVTQADVVTDALPAVGSAIDVSGIPCSDLYHLNLRHAVWRLAKVPAAGGEPAAEDVTAAEILVTRDGRRRIQPRYHGQVIRLRGKVMSLPGEGTAEDVLRLYDGKFTVPVNATSCPAAFDGVTVGCDVEITGCCVLQMDSSDVAGRLPSFTGFMAVVRSPHDVRVLARPPWWTPGRLMAVVSALLALLAGIVVWNVLLRRLAERRGKELAAENIARAESDLRVYERTRLAVELHDSIAQNLSGVSLELDAAMGFEKDNPAEMIRHLGIAAKTLKSCRGELRNCMWDLRNQTLEDDKMDVAIRKTLAPHLGSAELSVRFAVVRENLSDNTALTILRIIRELTLNAIRHGKAKKIQIAGCIDNERLLFSVRDDGCGFNPANRPGIEDGHFGLQGVSERIISHGGDMRIDSRPGVGTKVTLTIPIPATSFNQGRLS